MSEAQSRLSAIYANKEHPYWKGDPKAIEEVYKLTQLTLGADGRKIVAQFG